ncbi:hypothetical protein PPERSA_03759 [Pseudocohnilembus persalinus]|uniref:SAM-dependent RNA methyltransferase n=1 Tax=Pseudocohnilembus persalinus TaxID=266149 RepID=A0A0V0QBL5_PSEPJ|nr:hypothetical protein PPERSA_03759 [Pseudocohnilembus persalinus]|eukprot:KRW99584.1 hypothetical protein PPERSA_03759 [Pseudocohnilembus persalinus]
MEQKNQNKHYIVEHMDDGLFDWSLAEYKEMTKYLKTDKREKSSLIFSNTTQFLSENDPEDNEKYQKNIQEIEKENVTFLEKKLHTYFDEKGNLVLPEKNINVPFERICLLDMRGDRDLEPADAKDFDCFLFGGILGDHPPKDRTKELRQIGFKQKRLGDIQLTTDTALLITKLIIENGHKFDEIPYAIEPDVVNKKDPTECTQMEGFRYVTKQYDIEKDVINFENQDQNSKQPVMSAKIMDELLFEPLNLGPPL